MRDGLDAPAYRRALADGAPLVATSQFGGATVHLEEPSALLGTALHHSHHIRADLVPKLAISDEDRLYEEDPETQRFTGSLTSSIVPNQSRYELDLNRSPDVTIYARPELAWGKRVWAEPLTQQETELTLEKWYEYHSLVDAAVEDAIERFGRAIVLDIHSYNFQREAYVDWRTDGKPCINLGTKHLQLDDEGQALKDWFFKELEGHTLLGEEMLVQENAVFNGGYLNRRLSRRFGPRCITLSVEYKKVFMDERTGAVDEKALGDLVDQFDASVRALGERIGAPVRATPVVPLAATDA